MMVTIKTSFHLGNLLLDPRNPYTDIPDDGYCGDINTGTWYKKVKMNVHFRTIY